MGVVGLMALVANVIVALILFRYRDGDSDMRSVWLCSRNDAIGNVAVMGAALGVFGTGTAWPDLAVATVMGGLAITAGSAWCAMPARTSTAQNRRQPIPSVRKSDNSYWGGYRRDNLYKLEPHMTHTRSPQLFPYWQRFTMLAALLAAAFLWPASTLEWSREGIPDGEYWRLLTGHWVHLGLNHLLLNLAGLLVTGLLITRHPPCQSG